MRPPRIETSINLGLVPPQAVELEKAILGAILLERDALIEIAGDLKSEFFYTDQHQMIAESILMLFRAGEAVDLLTVTAELQKMGKLDVAGGAFYLTELTSRVASAANIHSHMRIVQEAYLKRMMIRLGGELQKNGFDDTQDVFELMDYGQLQLINMLGGLASNRAVSLKESAYQAFQQMGQNMARKEKGLLTGIPTPFDALNQFTGGWQKGDLIILAARPAMGKTALALAFARAAAKDQKAVLFFSLEMVHLKLTYRLIAQELKTKSVTEMQRGDLTDIELKAMTMGASRLTNYQISIDDQAGMTLMQLRSKATRMKATGELEMIIVDYLQLMHGDGGKNQTNREQEISAISRGLKILAKDLDVPVIALAQLSRAVETRGGDKKPQLADLRESGAIEQDADMVIFLWRPEYYGMTEIDFENVGTISTSGLAVGIIAKHRNGGVGPFMMSFDSKHVDFMDYQRPSSRDSDWPTAKNL